MRTAGSALLVILGLLLAAVAGPALWLERNVVDGAGFAQLAGPLGSAPETLCHRIDYPAQPGGEPPAA